VGPRKHVLGEVRTGATWRIPLNCSCAAAMRPVVKLLSPLVMCSSYVKSAQDIQMSGAVRYLCRAGGLVPLLLPAVQRCPL